MGDADKYIIGEKTYDLSYRMSPPVFRDVFSLNLIAAEWDEPLNNITFSIIFPKSLDPSTINVFGGQFGDTSLSENCSYECLSEEIAGQCNTLWRSALTVTVPINRLYFIPTTAQFWILIIESALLLFVIIYLIHFCCMLRKVDTNESPFLSPTEASQLLFDEVNPHVELLYLASQGKVQFTNVGTTDFTVTFSESGLEPFDSVSVSASDADSNSNFPPMQNYSGKI
jgi:hypothetical protein